MAGGHSQGKQHALGEEHKKNEKAIVMQRSANAKHLDEKAQAATEKAKRVKRAEIRMAMFMVEHNIPFRITDHMLQLTQAIAQEAPEMKCGKTKCRMIVKNVVGKYSHEELLKALICHKFCLIVDE